MLCKNIDGIDRHRIHCKYLAPQFYNCRYSPDTEQLFFVEI